MIRALALTGPTASGKTALSLHIARELGCEILSLDSMQIYRRMSIGTAKATAEEQGLVPHHLIDIIDPGESFSAEDYRERAIELCREIAKRGKIPFFVGGTGLYIDTVMRGGAPVSPPSDPALRDELTAIGTGEDGRERLWRMLYEVDPESAAKIHKNNLRRVVRAIEIYRLTGRTKTELDRIAAEANSELDVRMITLDFHNRDTLYGRIDMRVDAMLAEGLEAEVRALYSDGLLRGESTCSQAIGYKEMIDYIEGRSTLVEAIEQIKLASRRYAKRQLTWFRHEMAERLFVDGEDGVMKGNATICIEALDLAKKIYYSEDKK